MTEDEYRKARQAAKDATFIDRYRMPATNFFAQAAAAEKAHRAELDRLKAEGATVIEHSATDASVMIDMDWSGLERWVLQAYQRQALEALGLPK